MGAELHLQLRTGIRISSEIRSNTTYQPQKCNSKGIIRVAHRDCGGIARKRKEEDAKEELYLFVTYVLEGLKGIREERKKEE